MDILNCPKFTPHRHTENEKINDKEKVSKRFSKLYGANPNNNSKEKEK